MKGIDKDTQREHHVTKEADWKDAATSQGMSRTDSYHKKLGRGKEGFYSVSESAWPC